MKKLNDKQMSDLGKLAIDRCAQSFLSVAQLMENGPQAYALAVTVICTFVLSAAEQLADGMEQQNGERPAKEIALGYIVADVLDGLGVTWRRSNSPTRSEKK